MTKKRSQSNFLSITVASAQEKNIKDINVKESSHGNTRFSHLKKDIRKRKLSIGLGLVKRDEDSTTANTNVFNRKVKRFTDKSNFTCTRKKKQDNKIEKSCTVVKHQEKEEFKNGTNRIIEDKILSEFGQHLLPKKQKKNHKKINNSCTVVKHQEKEEFKNGTNRIIEDKILSEFGQHLLPKKQKKNHKKINNTIKNDVMNVNTYDKKLLTPNSHCNKSIVHNFIDESLPILHRIESIENITSISAEADTVVIPSNTLESFIKSPSLISQFPLMDYSPSCLSQNIDFPLNTLLPATSSLKNQTNMFDKHGDDNISSISHAPLCSSCATTTAISESSSSSSSSCESTLAYNNFHSFTSLHSLVEPDIPAYDNDDVHINNEHNFFEQSFSIWDQILMDLTQIPLNVSSPSFLPVV